MAIIRVHFHEVLQSLITEISLNIAYPKFHWNLPGVSELMRMKYQHFLFGGSHVTSMFDFRICQQSYGCMWSFTVWVLESLNSLATGKCYLKYIFFKHVQWNLDILNINLSCEIVPCECPRFSLMTKNIGSGQATGHYLKQISQARQQAIEPSFSKVYDMVRSRNCGCLVTWFCYQLIAKPGNKTAAVSWPDPYDITPRANKLTW